MKWALNTYRVCQDWELDRILEIAGATGYEAVELLMDYEQKHGFEWDTHEDRWQGLKDRVDESDVVISSLTSCQRFQYPGPDERAESMRRVKRVIDMSEFMGCDHVRMLGDRFDDETRDAVIGYVTDAMAELGDYAAPKGVTVSIEMHGSFTEPDPAMAVIEGVNRQNVGFVFNSQFRDCEGGSIEPLFSRIGPHLTAVHTHQAESPETFELYRQMFQWLKANGFEGYVSNECAYTGPDPQKVLALYVALFKAFTG